MVKVEIELYDFEELSPKAKTRALESGRNSTEFDSTFTVEYLEEILIKLGVQDANLSFSGFYSQGSGASFTGLFYPNKEPNLDEFPEEIHEAVLRLSKLEGISVHITRRGRYAHSGAMSLSVEMVDNPGEEVPDTIEQEAASMLRKVADYAYSELEKEYNFQTSDEQVTESLEGRKYLANGTQFCTNSFTSHA